MRLTERSMLNLATDVRATDLLAADIERRHRGGSGDDRRGPASDRVRGPRPGRLTDLRRLIPGGGHA